MLVIDKGIWGFNFAKQEEAAQFAQKMEVRETPVCVYCIAHIGSRSQEARQLMENPPPPPDPEPTPDPAALAAASAR